jgi:hypothetical protein
MIETPPTKCQTRCCVRQGEGHRHHGRSALLAVVFELGEMARLSLFHGKNEEKKWLHMRSEPIDPVVAYRSQESHAFHPEPPCRTTRAAYLARTSTRLHRGETCIDLRAIELPVQRIEVDIFESDVEIERHSRKDEDSRKPDVGGKAIRESSKDGLVLWPLYRDLLKGARQSCSPFE